MADHDPPDALTALQRAVRQVFDEVLTQRPLAEAQAHAATAVAERIRRHRSIAPLLRRIGRPERRSPAQEEGDGRGARPQGCSSLTRRSAL